MRSIIRPRGLLTPYFLPVLHLPLTPSFFTLGGHASPPGGRQRLAELWSPPGDYSGPAATNRTVRNTRGPNGRVHPGPAAVNRGVRPIRGPAADSRAVRPTRGRTAASRAVRPTRGTERWIPPGDRQWSAGQWSPPRDRQRSAGRCGPPGGPSGIAQPGTGSDQRAVRPIRGPVAASRAVQPTRGTEWYSPTGDRQRPAGGAAHPGDRAV